MLTCFLFIFFAGTFFTPFLNGFNQFTTRFNPFGRPLQSQPVFQQFPSQSQTFGQQRPAAAPPPPPPQQPQQQQPAPSSRPLQPTASPNFGNNFQTVRFPAQNQQFGVFPSQPQQQQPQFASFPQQQPRPQSQQPPPRPAFTAFNQFSPSTPVVPTQTAPPLRQAATEANTPPPFTPLQNQPPSPQFNQPQVFNQQSSRFPPQGSVSSSFAISSGTGSQSTSDFTQSFSGSLPPLRGSGGGEDDQQPQQSFDIESQQEAFRNSGGGGSSSAIDNTFASFPGRVPLRQNLPTKQPSAAEQQQASITEDTINGARVRIRPVGTIGNTDPTRIQELPNIEVTSPRARQPLVTRDPRQPSTGGGRDPDTRLGPTGVRVVRVRPTNRPFRTENFTPVEFIPQQEATPPPVITRVRGRPIVPDDFPGNPSAIRGKTPLDEDDFDVPTGPGQDSSNSGGGNEFNNNRGRFPSSSTTATGPSGSNTRTRTRLRIVPTGNRARRPVDNNSPSEEPRATSLSGSRGGSAPGNRIPFSSFGNDANSDSDTTASGFPRRRLRPVNRLPQQQQPQPPTPVRPLRPFIQEPSTPAPMFLIFWGVPRGRAFGSDPFKKNTYMLHYNS